MDIRISKESELPIYEQVASQILFLIGTGELQPGDLLPSVRGLATRLKIHHNTVSHAYRRLVEDKFLARRRGSRLAVRSLNEGPEPQAAQGLDDLIDGAIASAQAGGYTLQQLHRRIKERMEEQPPDRILAVSRDVGLRILLQQELRRGVGVRVESCSPSDLRADRDLATGALVTVTPGAMSEVRPLLPKRHPVVQIGFSDAVEHLAKIRKLQQPSIITVASVSEYFLETARSLLSATAGDRHSISVYLVRAGERLDLDAADIILCDSILGGVIAGDNVLIYKLLSRSFLERISKILIQEG